MLRVLLFITLFCMPMAVQAQPFEVVSSSPGDAAVGVPLETTISFTFSRPLNATAMLNLIPAIASFNLIEVNEEGISFTNGNRTINVPVTHLESRDYSWTVFMALSEENEPLARPYVLNYTTEGNIGQHSVSGTVTIHPFSEAFAKQAGDRSFANPLLRSLLRIPGFQEQLADLKPELQAATFAKQQSIHDPTNTVIFLIEGEFDFEFDDFDNGDDELDEIPDVSIARAGMVPASDGNYSVTHVRDGEYMPVAVRFRSVQPGFLFFDAVGVHFDEDGEVTPITVQGGSLTGIDITAFAIEPMTAHEAEAEARDFAEEMADDAELYYIEGFPVEPDGNAYVWEFIFYSPENDFTMYMPVPFGLDFPEIIGGRDFPESATPIPDAYLNSTSAIEIAEANGGAQFRAETGVYVIFIEGGNLIWEFESPELQERHVWKVQYLAAGLDLDDPEIGSDYLEVFLDMVTGEVIDVRRAVSSEPVTELPAGIALSQNYPNPFNPATTIPFQVSEPGNIQLEIFDVLGRHVARPVDGFHTAGTYTVSWDATGVASGIYVYRLRSGDSVLSRKMVIMK